jgi:nucleoside-diphosphate-sugar epimerase
MGMKPKVLLTGSTGFVGRHVVNYLLQKNVTLITTSTSNPDLKTYPELKKIKHVKCDLAVSKRNFFDFFEKPDILIHLAWKGLPNYDKPFHFEKNLFNDFAFIKNMVENGLKRVVVSGTCFEYGKKEGCLSEETETMPKTSYAFAKDSLRKMLEQLSRECSFSLLWIRLFYMYGTGQNPKSLLPMLESAIKRGDREFNLAPASIARDYLPIEKVAKNIAELSLKRSITGIINNCSGKPTTIGELAQKKVKELKSNIRLNFGDYPISDREPIAFWGCTKKLKKALKK